MENNDNKIYGKEINPIELVEVLKKMETKFQTQRSDINIISQSLRNLQMDYNEYKKDITEIFKEQMTTFDSIFESNNAEEQSAKGTKTDYEYNNIIKELLKSDFSAKIQQIEDQIQKNAINIGSSNESKKDSNSNIFIWVVFAISIANLLLILKLYF